jgi:anti-sigma B factor antagonist
MSEFAVTEKHEDDKTVFSLDGKLTVTTAPILEDTLGEEFANGMKNLDLDLHELEYISSAGLRVIVSAQKKAMSAGGSMCLLHPNEEVYEVFEMTGLLDILNVVN